MPELPFVVVNPQCPHDLIWSQCAEDLHRIIHEVIRMHGNVDLSRIYLTGLSMGGMGCWTLAMAFPSMFAAVAPICGAFIPPPPPKVAAERMAPDGFEMFGLRDTPTLEHGESLQHLPFYIVHGAKDDAVPVSGSLEIFARLKEAGAPDVTLVVYPDVDGLIGHDSWSQTYENPEFYRWLLSKRKPETGKL
jgi:predicted peptidase